MLDHIARRLEESSDRPAFLIDGTAYSYAQLASKVAAIQELIGARCSGRKDIITIVDNADFETYASVIAVLFSGHAYLPLNPKAPLARNLAVLDQVETAVMLSSDTNAADTILRAKPQLSVFRTLDLGPTGRAPVFASALESDLAYLLFTSGSTGTPKGVPISRGNLSAFLRSLGGIINLDEQDRVLQMFDLTFDFSVMSLFAPLTAGACVCPTGPAEPRFITVYRLLEEAEITCAPMVPSVINFLRPYFGDISLDRMRLSIFCGEPLLLDVALEWAQCGKHMRTLNFYGPTEATVFCSYYELSSENRKAVNGAVSIGKAMPGSTMFVVDGDGGILSEGETGELCIVGNQLSTGYWRDPKKTAESFVEITVASGVVRAYRTGDSAYADRDSDFMYLGRLDHQVKVQGYRIELAEVEQAARLSPGVNQVAVVAVSRDSGLVELVLCLGGFVGDAHAVLERMRAKLPSYMIPGRVVTLDELPLNPNGKIDRNSLKASVAK